MYSYVFMGQSYPIHARFRHSYVYVGIGPIQQGFIIHICRLYIGMYSQIKDICSIAKNSKCYFNKKDL